ncbi:type II secretion system F family protein [Actinoplanes sp. TFC3]|uniref:type II secretion system F family protein n=1 Tax=Actinoplanes sp. TFC3 TaxID=1710355 RepID=UPI000A9DFC2C|nr:hypothetical protein [Actinoplanes sp. TFC3]
MMPPAHLMAAALLLVAALLVLVPVSVGLERLGGRAAAPGFSMPDLRAIAARSHRRFMVLAAASAVLPGFLGGGVVGALLCTAYAVLVAHLLAKQWTAQRRAAQRERDLEDLTAQAADLRAGAGQSVSIGGRLGELANAAGQLADRIGAPVADLLDRIEADARTADRIRAKATAEAAGTRATSLLLALLPLGGIGLGYSIGADPLDVLLHTPAGAGCALTAALLQIAGVLWTERLTPEPAP